MTNHAYKNVAVDTCTLQNTLFGDKLEASYDANPNFYITWK